IIGHEVGEWHVTHDKLLFYFHHLAAQSPRIRLDTIGYTHEKRPLIQAIITHPDNDPEQLRKAHLEALENKNSNPETPSILLMGYSIHGNEPSGGNAALLTAYHLAAMQGERAEAMLKNMIIILDPCFNPDGFQRFSTWVNMHKSDNPSTQGISREFNEVYPRGRSNHYWFDLNRDWLPIVHPESQARIAAFHRWKPHILTDHHEMGANSTFFFQPGVPSRTNPLTPAENQKLTAEIGNFHAEHLERIGSTFYTKESFDDFYYGKGSTYPDANGCIGILFEQASSRGHLRSTVNGIMSFAFTIRNQFTTSLSTLEAGYALRKKLRDYQRNFYRERKSAAGGYVFGDKHTATRSAKFAELLAAHQIECYHLNKNFDNKGQNFDKDYSYFVPRAQMQAHLIEGVFQKETSFSDSIFYDISAWTFPMAYGLPYAETKNDLKGEKIKDLSFAIDNQKNSFEQSNYAYLIEPFAYELPTALYALLSENLKLKVANKSLKIKNLKGNAIELPVGTVLLTAKNQAKNEQQIFEQLEQLAESHNLKVHAVGSGLAAEGIDLGSPNFKALRFPRAIMVLDERTYGGGEEGEIWHYFDKKLGMPLTMVEDSRATGINWSDYNVIILANGSYSKMSDKAWEALQNRVAEGATLIAQRNAVRTLSGRGILPLEFAQEEQNDSIVTPRAYHQLAADKGSAYIGGAIFEGELDTSHPLAFGISQIKIPVFKNTTMFAKLPSNPYATPLRMSKNPLLSGYASEKNKKLAAESAVVTARSYQRGIIIGFLTVPTFRGYWLGTERLLANAIFFGHTIDSRSASW
ncbi:MAG: zinc carboxypeptidase, partial [Bernardetiaceae bacterium]|nr:zinc carboxypeptidase [Bernardetiaceae bacterium]